MFSEKEKKEEILEKVNFYKPKYIKAYKLAINFSTLLSFFKQDCFNDFKQLDKTLCFKSKYIKNYSTFDVNKKNIAILKLMLKKKYFFFKKKELAPYIFITQQILQHFSFKGPFKTQKNFDTFQKMLTVYNEAQIDSTFEKLFLPKNKTAVPKFLDSYFWTFFSKINPTFNFFNAGLKQKFGSAVVGLEHIFKAVRSFKQVNFKKLRYGEQKKITQLLNNSVTYNLSYAFSSTLIKKPALSLFPELYNYIGRSTAYKKGSGIFVRPFLHFNPTKQNPRDFNERTAKGKHWLEIIWGLIPIYIITAIYIPSLIVLNEIEREDNPIISIKIVGMQWEWVYEYNHILGQRGIYTSRLLREREQLQNLAKIITEGLILGQEVKYPFKPYKNKKINIYLDHIEYKYSFETKNFSPSNFNEILKISKKRISAPVTLKDLAPSSRIRTKHSLDYMLTGISSKPFSRYKNFYVSFKGASSDSNFTDLICHIANLKTYNNTKFLKPISFNLPEQNFKNLEKHAKKYMTNFLDFQNRIATNKNFSNYNTYYPLNNKILKITTRPVNLNKKIIKNSISEVPNIIPGSELSEYFKFRLRECTGLGAIQRLQPFVRYYSTNKPMVIPWNTETRLLVTSRDVIHSWAVPAFGFKVDAIPGRINRSCVTSWRLGFFYGQCSELCGIGHAFMPISVYVVSVPEYLNWLNMLRVGVSNYKYQQKLINISTFSYIV